MGFDILVNDQRLCPLPSSERGTLSPLSLALSHQGHEGRTLSPSPLRQAQWQCSSLLPCHGRWGWIERGIKVERRGWFPAALLFPVYSAVVVGCPRRPGFEVRPSRSKCACLRAYSQARQVEFGHVVVRHCGQARGHTPCQQRVAAEPNQRSRLVRSPSSLGISPVNRLLLRCNCFRADRSPNSIGMRIAQHVAMEPQSLQTRQLTQRVPGISAGPTRCSRRYSCFRLDMSPKSSGMPPLSMLSRRSSSSRLTRLPRPSGISPVKPVSSSPRRVRLVSSPQRSRNRLTQVLIPAEVQPLQAGEHGQVRNATRQVVAEEHQLGEAARQLSRHHAAQSRCGAPRVSAGWSRRSGFRYP